MQKKKKKKKKKQELGCFEHLESIPQPFFVPPQPFCMGQRLSEKSKNLKKKKFFFFFTSAFEACSLHLGTLLGPKKQKKQELGCFEHLEFIPQPFSAPPVHFVWASALSKNRKISKKNFFFGKISTTEVGLWAPKNAKKCKNRVF